MPLAGRTRIGSREHLDGLWATLDAPEVEFAEVLKRLVEQGLLEVEETTASAR